MPFQSPHPACLDKNLYQSVSAMASYVGVLSFFGAPRRTQRNVESSVLTKPPPKDSSSTTFRLNTGVTSVTNCTASKTALCLFSCAWHWSTVLPEPRAISTVHTQLCDMSCTCQEHSTWTRQFFVTLPPLPRNCFTNVRVDLCCLFAFSVADPDLS